MKEDAFGSFLTLSERDRRDVFEAAPQRLDTFSDHMEKDFQVCLVLDALYNRLPDGHPRLLFKGGISLSKASHPAVLRRHRSRLRRSGLRGRPGSDYPGGLSNKKRNALELVCGGYVLGNLSASHAARS